MFDPLDVAIAFGRFLRQFEPKIRAPLIGGVAMGCLADAPEEVQVEFIERVAHEFNLGFFRVERPGVQVDTGATTDPTQPGSGGSGGGIYLGRILPSGNA